MHQGEFVGRDHAPLLSCRHGVPVRQSHPVKALYMGLRVMRLNVFDVSGVKSALSVHLHKKRDLQLGPRSQPGLEEGLLFMLASVRWL